MPSTSGVVRTTEEYERALQDLRKSFRSITPHQNNIAFVSKMETDVGKFVAAITSVAKSPVDKRRIATQLNTDAQAELLAVGKSTEDEQLAPLELANKRRAKEYLVNIATEVLQKFQA